MITLLPLDIDDVFDLDRFVEAQSRDYDRAMTELRDGHKRTHWIWYVFPQLKHLGKSPTSEFYGLASLNEARAYLAHPVLGARLRESTGVVMAHAGKPLVDIFGSPDDMKFRSCMTLFQAASDEPDIFSKALDAFCDGVPDEKTFEILARKAGGGRAAYRRN